MNIIGKVLKDRYEIIAEIGKGGMSTVYLSRDKKLGSYWAIKRVTRNVEVFKKEVKLLSSLNHSDVPRIVDKIEIGEEYFVVMDFISGVSLGKKVAEEGPQKEEDIVKWAKMLADVLYYLHTVRENPIVYKDVKPDNIILTDMGRIKLVDFGIAKECVRGHKEIGKKFGTKGYAAPEQYKDEALDERTDIYSLGVTLYYLITGKAPTGPDDTIIPIRQINLAASEGLEYVINKCVQSDPNKRYQNCKELRYDLDNIITLNSSYRNKMKRKVISFSMSVMAFIISVLIIFCGNAGMQNNQHKAYDFVFAKAVKERDMNNSNAIQDFQNAINIDSGKVEAYQELFNTLLPNTGDKQYIEKTKNAITILRNYIDKPDASLKRKPEFVQLQYKIFKTCLQVNDSLYAKYAYDLLTNDIKKSDEYKKGNFDTNEVESYGVIADCTSKDIERLNFNELRNQLENLEKNTNNSQSLQADDKLNNYYILIRIYNTYPDKLKDSYNKINNIGMASKKIIDSNRKINFRYVTAMQQIVAESLYDNAQSCNDLATKRELLSKSIEWFGYLEDLKTDLQETAEITKGDAYRDLFETYNTVDQYKNITPAIVDNLNKAVAAYNDILIHKNNNSFLAALKLTGTYLDIEAINHDDETKNKIQETYKKVIQLKNQEPNMDISTLSQYSSLKQQMQDQNMGGE